MDPVVQVGLGWLLFAGTHIGLALGPIRRPLVRRTGEIGFLVLYSLIASVGFVVLATLYADLRGDGPAGPALAEVAWARWTLIGVGLLGMALMVGAFAPRAYWESPIMVVVGKPRPPYGLERITRHPFFTGLVLLMGAHTLLSTRLVGSVFFGGFVVLSVLGSAHQGRKLLARHGGGYRDFLAATSAVPLVAIATGRQRLVAGEIPWRFLLLGVAGGVGLHRLHPDLLAHRGIGLSASVVLLSWLIGLRAVWKSR